MKVLILALNGIEAIGCVGVRKIEPGIAELKRLYVRDSHRGLKVGVTLLEKAVESARNLGYSRIRLDVIPTLQKAKQLYQSFGFYEIPHYFNRHYSSFLWQPVIVLCARITLYPYYS